MLYPENESRCSPFPQTGKFLAEALEADVRMKCLRIYASPDGESHFGDVDIAMTIVA
jgi:hypothetical protein